MKIAMIIFLAAGSLACGSDPEPLGLGVGGKSEEAGATRAVILLSQAIDIWYYREAWQLLDRLRDQLAENDVVVYECSGTRKEISPLPSELGKPPTYSFAFYSGFQMKAALSHLDRRASNQTVIYIGDPTLSKEQVPFKDPPIHVVYKYPQPSASGMENWHVAPTAKELHQKLTLILGFE